MGTRGGGLNRFVEGEESFIRFTGDEAHPRDLVSPAITAIAEDGEGRLWIGTSWDGLRVWDREVRRIFDSQTGFPGRGFSRRQ